MRPSPTRDRGARRPAILAVALAVTFTLAGCSSKPALPSNFEVIGESSTGAGNYYTLRDTGTGCEFIAGPHGMLPRNERSADGVNVKQRCVITGDEPPVTTPPGTTQQFGTTPAQTGQPAFAPQGAAAGGDPQEEALRAAIREQAQGAIPPAAAPTPTIPPPRGARRAAPAAQPQQAASEDDGVESQLKQ